MRHGEDLILTLMRQKRILTSLTGLRVLYELFGFCRLKRLRSFKFGRGFLVFGQDPNAVTVVPGFAYR